MVRYMSADDMGDSDDMDIEFRLYLREYYVHTYVCTHLCGFSMEGSSFHIPPHDCPNMMMRIYVPMYLFSYTNL